MAKELNRLAEADEIGDAEKSAPPTSPPGYQLIAEIGRGGMAVVYRARDAALERDVAVKLLAQRYPPDSLPAQRLRVEAHIAGQLQHRGIPAVHQVTAFADWFDRSLRDRRD